MRRCIENLFAVFLIIFVGLGICTVLIQAVGLMSQDGSLMIFASKKIMPYAVLGSTIAGAISFIYPYFLPKEKK